jgi:hypothetical protein
MLHNVQPKRIERMEPRAGETSREGGVGPRQAHPPSPSRWRALRRARQHSVNDMRKALGIKCAHRIDIRCNGSGVIGGYPLQTLHPLQASS